MPKLEQSLDTLTNCFSKSLSQQSVKMYQMLMRITSSKINLIPYGWIFVLLSIIISNSAL